MEAPEEKLKQTLTDEFLNNLIFIARCYGWGGDYIEIRDFVDWCHDKANKPKPTREEMEPYD